MNILCFSIMFVIFELIKKTMNLKLSKNTIHLSVLISESVNCILNNVRGLMFFSLLFFFMVVFSSSVFSQCDTNKISTNPENPISSDFDGLMKMYNFKINPFKNTWNWGASTDNNFNTILLNMNAGFMLKNFNGGMVSPYSLNMPSEYNYLNQNGALPQNCDIHWQDGWELMLMNLGFYPNKEKTNDSNYRRVIPFQSALLNSEFPYFVLYNRYNGILRFFGSYHQNFNNTLRDNIGITIGDMLAKKGSKVGAVFRHIGSYDRPLDQNTIHAYASSFNRNPKNNILWFSSDYQLGFDPCVCESSSLFQIDAFVFDDDDVVVDDYFNGKSDKLLPKFDEFIANHSIRDIYSTGSGLTVYKSYEMMINNNQLSQKKLNKLSKQSRGDLLAKLNVFKISSSMQKNGLLGNEVISDTIIDYLKRVLKNNSTFLSSGNLLNQFKNGSKLILGKDYNFFSNQTLNPKLSSQSYINRMPSVVKRDFNISGSYNTNGRAFLTNFFAPGSFNSIKNGLDMPSYPIYNKPVGLFALLNTPSLYFLVNKPEFLEFDWRYLESGDKVEVVEKKKRHYIISKVEKNITTTKIPHHLIAQLDYEQSFYFKLKQNLFYKLNHSVDFDFEKTKLYVSFMIEYESNAPIGDYYENNKYGIEMGERVIDLSESNLSIYQHFIKDGKLNNEKLILQTNWEDVKHSGELLFGGKMKVQMHKKIASGEFVKTSTEVKRTNLLKNKVDKYNEDVTEELNYSDYVSSMEDYENTINETIDKNQYIIKRVTMKLMSDMYFKQENSIGGQTNTNQVFTYLIFDSEQKVDLISEYGEWVKGSDFKGLVKYNPGVLNLDNEEITIDKPYVSSVVGNEINVNYEYINLSGNISVQTGYKVNLNAYYSIETIGNVNVSSGLNLTIKKDYYGMPITQEATQEYVNSYCSGPQKKYRADEFDDNPYTFFLPKSENISVKGSPIEFLVFPNPSNNMFNVNVNNNNEKDYEVLLFDLAGKLVFKMGYSGKQNTQQIETTGFSAGIYVVKLICGEYQNTQKLVLHNNGY